MGSRGGGLGQCVQRQRVRRCQRARARHLWCHVLVTEGTEWAEQREASQYLFTLDDCSLWLTILMADNAMPNGAPRTLHVGMEGTITIRGWPYMLDEFHPPGSERPSGEGVDRCHK